MSVQFAPVAPLDLHKAMADADPELWGRYHLLIATEILKDPIGYNRFWSQLEAPKTVIVDNGVIETGDALPLAQLAAAAVLVGATVVVMPDVVGDHIATVRASGLSQPKLRDMLPSRTQLMGVAQGQTQKEVWTCLGQLNAMGADWLSVPKGYAERGVGDRTRVTKTAAQVFGKPLHTLGLSDNYVDDVGAAQWAQGLDSAMPVWLGAEGIRIADLPQNSEVFGRRPPTYWYWRTLSPSQQEAIMANLMTMRYWLNGE